MLQSRLPMVSHTTVSVAAIQFLLFFFFCTLLTIYSSFSPLCRIIMESHSLALQQLSLVEMVT